MCNLSWTPHSNLEKDNSLKTTPVLAQRWAVWSILTKNQVGPTTEVGLRVIHYKSWMILPFHVQPSISCRYDGKGHIL